MILCRPWGASGHKAFVCPISLTIGSSLHSTSMTFPEFKQLLIEEGSKWETKKKDSSVALGQGTISPSKDKTEVSLIYFADTESSSKWEKLINDWQWYAAYKHVDPRPAGLEGCLCWLLLSSSPTHYRNVHELIMPSFTIKLATIFLKLRHIGLRALAHCVPFCLAKQ